MRDVLVDGRGAGWLGLAALALAAGCAMPGPEPGSLPEWEAQVSGTSESLRGVCPVDQYLVWASGSHGTVLRTRDGGRSWESIAVAGGRELDFRDVYAVDADHAWLLTAGQPARIYHTADGGRSWEVQYADGRDGVFFDGMAFWADGRGVAFSDPVDGHFVVAVTDDGFRWQELPASALPAAVEGEAGFAASGSCVATWGVRYAWVGTGGAVARVLRSDDGGRTWQGVDTPIEQGSPSTGVFSVAFRDPAHGVAVGGDYRAPDLGGAVAARSEDGGLSWRLAAHPPLGYRSAVAWVGGLADPTWVAVGPSGSDWSRDDGRTWRPLRGGGYHAVAFVPGRPVGWAVGAGGRIARLEIVR